MLTLFLQWYLFVCWLLVIAGFEQLAAVGGLCESKVGSIEIFCAQCQLLLPAVLRAGNEINRSSAKYLINYNNPSLPRGILLEVPIFGAKASQASYMRWLYIIFYNLHVE